MSRVANGPRTVKVAVVGSGLAGLTAAHLLSSSQSNVDFEVHVFEKSSSLGMDSSSVSIPVPGQKGEWRIDVPMRSFQGGYYHQLIQLYQSLGVAFRQADFSYSFSQFSPPTTNHSRQITTTMIYNGASGREGVSMPSMMNFTYLQTKGESMAARALTKAITWLTFILITMQVVFNYLRLIFLSVPFMRPKHLEHLTFRDWTLRTVPRGVLARWSGLDVAWEDFTKQILVPLFSAVCTASEADVMDHPMAEFLDYVWLTFGTHHYVVINGVRDVVTRLTASIRHIHVSSPISAIRAESNDLALASIECVTPEGTKTHSGFHHIIFGTQANSAVPILKNYLASLPADSLLRNAIEDQIRCLQTFRYQPTIVINHMDGTLMPDTPDDRRDLNLVCLDTERTSNLSNEPADSDCVAPSYTMATHVLPRPLQYPSSSPTVYQTTNPIISPRKDSILSVARLERAVLTADAKDALSGLHQETHRKWWQCAVQASSGLGPLQGAGKLSTGVVGPGIWLCGSYAYPGIPLLEGCVVSARNVVEQGVLRCEGIEAVGSPW